MSIIEEQTRIDTYYKECETILSGVISSCTKDLDAYVHNITENYSNVTTIDNQTLDNIILNLPMLIYYSISAMEVIGMKNDLSSINKKQTIAQALSNLDIKGTKAEKQTLAELESMSSCVIDDIYDRAYKTVKVKIDTAYEILASCKKIMSRRIEELKVEHSDTGRLTLHS